MKIGVIGNYGGKKTTYGGQTIKTISFYKALKEARLYSAISKLDTYDITKRPFSFIYRLRKLFKDNDVVVILLSQRGIRYLLPIILYYKNKFNVLVYYNVIGAWLAGLVQKHKYMLNISKLDGILVETNTLKKNLLNIGITNTTLYHNFKDLTKVANIKKNNYGIIKLCFFSRVTKQKGIEDAIEAINDVNNFFKKTIFTLDIYGPIESSYKNKLDDILLSNNFFEYKGVISPNSSVEIIKNYDLQIFPTKHYTEGIPGSIIDSYFSGVPIIASKWESYQDVIDEGHTGIGYEFGNIEDLKDKLVYIHKNRELIPFMSEKCLIKSEDYTKEKAMNDFFRIIMSN